MVENQKISLLQLNLGLGDNTMKSSLLTVIIYSCWKNRDMWDVFSVLFRKYWANCIYKVVLVTDEYHDEEKRYVFDDIIVLDDTWARMIKAAIKKTATKYVMLWMDDYLLCDYVSDDDIQRQIDRGEKYNALNIRLVYSPWGYGGIYDGDNIGYYISGGGYSLSLQPGIWNAKLLMGIIEDDWSAWDFERVGSLRKTDTQYPILVAHDYVFPYVEGVRKGKWMQEGARLCERNGIKLDEHRRPIMTNLEMAIIYFKGAILDINTELVLKIQNTVNCLKRK